uniref:Uncharacterized protein n=1 Tax=Meloidogyne enterolobii TaxID=390850 RepID=A0A6V7VHX9_MELEN|nr:unnamed protein product [Meloidogyne enterolobii]
MQFCFNSRLLCLFPLGSNCREEHFEEALILLEKACSLFLFYFIHFYLNFKLHI